MAVSGTPERLEEVRAEIKQAAAKSERNLQEIELIAVSKAHDAENVDWSVLADRKMTVVVLDNAGVHTSRQVQERRPFWQQRGLYIFYLPAYAPHLNIAERLWRKLKYEWLQPADYATADGLFYQVRQVLAAVGTSLKIRFSEFSLGLS